MDVTPKHVWPQTVTVNFHHQDRSWELLKNLFPEMKEYTLTSSAQTLAIARFHLIDSEVETHSRLILLSQINPDLKVIFTRTYPLDWLESSQGFLYQHFIGALREKPLIGAPALFNGLEKTILPTSKHQLSSSSTQVVLVDVNVILNEDIQNITHIAAEENYVRIHFTDGSTTFTRGPLKHWEELLSHAHFVRIGRSLVINMKAITRLHKVSRNLGLLTMTASQQPIPLGRKAFYTLKEMVTQQKKTKS